MVSRFQFPVPSPVSSSSSELVLFQNPKFSPLLVPVVLLRYNNRDTQLLLLITSSSLELKKISSEIQHILLAPR
jgi:hypothetical protein